MITIDQHTTIADAFFAAEKKYAELSLLAVPINPARAYAPDGLEISYAQAAQQVRVLMQTYRAAGYGLGHRVALFLESRPEHMLHKLALNALGICCVPINPDYRSRELVYLIEHAQIDLVVLLPEKIPAVQAALEQSRHQAACAAVASDLGWAAGFVQTLPAAPRPAEQGKVSAEIPASILYTSGTTGQPKGCVLSHRYELAAGDWYARQPGLVSMREGTERLYNPLPLFHVNASILSFYCMLLTGGCQVQTDRFQPTRWWQEVNQSRATIVHYLGVVLPMLLAQPPSPLERAHRVRLGYGAGAEPQLHALFEEQFGMPLVELWGMTENVRTLSDCEAPRQIGSRAFGRAQPGLEVQVSNEQGRAVPDGTPGEMYIRHSAATPRQDFFSGYWRDEAATEAAWHGGWFHTGDVVTRAADGMLHFMDRRKNIIRRSGENIAAAEVEAVLLSHPWIDNAAVMAVHDEVREEEVLACIVLSPEGQQAMAADEPEDFNTPSSAFDEKLTSSEIFSKDENTLREIRCAQQLSDFCQQEMAYYKAPGWWHFTDQIPTTGTQKIQKHRIFAQGSDPREHEAVLDLRSRKKRQSR